MSNRWAESGDLARVMDALGSDANLETVVMTRPS